MASWGDFSTDELAWFIRLWEVLIEIDLVPANEDKAIWAWNAVGEYTSASAYKMLWEGGIRFQPTVAIWKSWAPLSCKIFMCLAVQYRLWT